MTDQGIINKIRKHKPKTIEDIKAIGFAPRFVRAGSARDVYKIGGLAIKIERNLEKIQTEREIRAMTLFHQDPQYQMLRVHIPPLYYANPEAGLIVTKFYPTRSEDGDNLSNFIQKMESYSVYDLFTNNVHADEHGNLVAIDLGYYKGHPDTEND